MTLAEIILIMKTHRNLYKILCSVGNITIAWRKAREKKTQRPCIIEFEKDIEKNLVQLHYELKNKTYKPRLLTTFPIRDPKTRIISKSHFRDRVAHHAIINIIGPILEKSFIYDSCANQRGKGTLFAIKRLHQFMKESSDNGHLIHNSLHDTNFIKGHCLKADIKHYFQEVDHEILMKIISRKIRDKDALWLIRQVLNNVAPNNQLGGGERQKLLFIRGMSLGNLTSQFLANVYLNELDYFVKHTLNAKYYIRYVDDFVILHKSKQQLDKWKRKVDLFLRNKLNLELHPQKSRVIPLS